jgi:hypothetical protein
MENSKNFFHMGMKPVAEQHYEEIRDKFLPNKFGINFDGWTESHIHYDLLFFQIMKFKFQMKEKLES